MEWETCGAMFHLRPWMIFYVGVFGCPGLLGLNFFIAVDGFHLAPHVVGFICALAIAALVPLCVLSAMIVQVWNEGNTLLARIVSGIIGVPACVLMGVAVARDWLLVVGLVVPMAWCGVLILLAFFSRKVGWIR